MKQTILRVEHITKKYGTENHPIYALKGVDLQLHKGELVIIMGASGSGKSTFLNILAGLDEPATGKLFIEDQEIKQFYREPYASAYRRRHIGFVFQFFNLITSLSVFDNVALPLMLEGFPMYKVKHKTNAMLELVGLTNRKNHLPSQLSGGQQQRVALARALIHQPAILLADEPTGNLDSQHTDEMMKLMIRMRDELGQAIILVTHDPAVAAYGDRIIHFCDGLIARDSVNEVVVR